jgi:microcompartment protein CcmK/EutM
MIIGKIIGTVVCTRKDDRLVPFKLLLVQPIDTEGKPSGNYLVAVDTVDAGASERVMVVSGSSARMTSVTKDCPVDAAIIGVVDTIDFDSKR